MKANREKMSTFDHLANMQKYADFNKATELYANLFKFRNNQNPEISQLYTLFNNARSSRKQDIELKIIELEKISRRKFYTNLTGKLNDVIKELEKIDDNELLYSVMHVFADKLQNLINLSENKLIESEDKESCKDLLARLEVLTNKIKDFGNENLVSLFQDFEIQIVDFQQKHQEILDSMPDNYVAKATIPNTSGMVGKMIGGIFGFIITIALFYDSPLLLIIFLIFDTIYLVRIIYNNSTQNSQNKDESMLQIKSENDNKKSIEKKLSYLEYYHPLREIYGKILSNVPQFSNSMSTIYQILANKDADFLVDFDVEEPEEMGTFDIQKALQDPDAIMKAIKKGNKLRAINLYKVKYNVHKPEAKKAIEQMIANGMETVNPELEEHQQISQ